MSASGWAQTAQYRQQLPEVYVRIHIGWVLCLNKAHVTALGTALQLSQA